MTGLAGDIALGSRQGSSDVVRRKSRQFRVRLLDVTGLAGHVGLDCQELIARLRGGRLSRRVELGSRLKDVGSPQTLPGFLAVVYAAARGGQLSRLC